MHDQGTIEVSTSGSNITNLGIAILQNPRSSLKTPSSRANQDVLKHRDSLTSPTEPDARRMLNSDASNRGKLENRPIGAKPSPSRKKRELGPNSKKISQSVNSSLNARVEKHHGGGGELIRNTNLAPWAVKRSRANIRHRRSSAEKRLRTVGDKEVIGRETFIHPRNIGLTVPRATFDDEVFVNDSPKLQSSADVCDRPGLKQTRPRSKTRKKRRKSKGKYKIDIIPVSGKTHGDSAVSNDKVFATALVLRPRKVMKKKKKKKRVGSPDGKIRKWDQTRPIDQSQSDTAVDIGSYTGERQMSRKRRLRSKLQERVAYSLSTPASPERKDSQQSKGRNFFELVKAVLQGRIRERNLAEKRARASNVVSSDSGVEKIAALLERRVQTLKPKKRRRRHRGGSGPRASRKTGFKTNSNNENQKEMDSPTAYSQAQPGQTKFENRSRQTVPQSSKMVTVKKTVWKASDSSQSLETTKQNSGLNRGRSSRVDVDMYKRFPTKLPQSGNNNIMGASSGLRASHLKWNLNQSFSSTKETHTGYGADLGDGTAEDYLRKQPAASEMKDSQGATQPMKTPISTVPHMMRARKMSNNNGPDQSKRHIHSGISENSVSGGIERGSPTITATHCLVNTGSEHEASPGNNTSTVPKKPREDGCEKSSSNSAAPVPGSPYAIKRPTSIKKSGKRSTKSVKFDATTDLEASPSLIPTNYNSPLVETTSSLVNRKNRRVRKTKIPNLNENSHQGIKSWPNDLAGVTTQRAMKKHFDSNKNANESPERLSVTGSQEKLAEKELSNPNLNKADDTATSEQVPEDGSYHEQKAEDQEDTTSPEQRLESDTKIAKPDKKVRIGGTQHFGTKKKPKKDPEKTKGRKPLQFHGWDDGKQLGDHTMTHLPQYTDIAALLLKVSRSPRGFLS